MWRRWRWRIAAGGGRGAGRSKALEEVYTTSKEGVVFFG